MAAENPNRYSWQGIYSWIEPVAGSRHEWKSDRWRYLKIAGCLLPAVVIVIWRAGPMDLLLWEIMAGFVTFTFVYLWIFTFFPRPVRLFDDRIAIYRVGARNLTASITVIRSS